MSGDISASDLLVTMLTETNTNVKEVRDDVKMILVKQGIHGARLDALEDGVKAARWLKRTTYAFIGTGIVDFLVNHWGKH